MNLNPAGTIRATVLGPAGWFGHVILGGVSYCGGLAILAANTAGMAIRPWLLLQLPDCERRLFLETVHQLSWMLAMGFPLVGLVHIGMGSFLALQAYYGSTFVDGTGAVVGVGLARNLATLMTGLTLSGFLSARIIPELRALKSWPTAEPAASRQSTDVRERRSQTRLGPGIHPLSMAAPRILAATVASPVLAFWGFLVGTFVGWQCADTMLGMMPSTFFMMFLRMIWYRDILGLLIKGTTFGFLITLIACYEGLRNIEGEPDNSDSPRSQEFRTNAVVHSVLRSTCLGMIAILFANSSWFILAYHANPLWGPTLLKPPMP